MRGRRTDLLIFGLRRAACICRLAGAAKTAGSIQRAAEILEYGD